MILGTVSSHLGSYAARGGFNLRRRTFSINRALVGKSRHKVLWIGPRVTRCILLCAVRIFRRVETFEWLKDTGY